MIRLLNSSISCGISGYYIVHALKKLIECVMCGWPSKSVAHSSLPRSRGNAFIGVCGQHLQSIRQHPHANSLGKRPSKSRSFAPCMVAKLHDSAVIKAGSHCKRAGVVFCIVVYRHRKIKKILTQLSAYSHLLNKQASHFGGW